MDEKKFAVILCAENAAEYQHIIPLINKIKVPNGCTMEVVMLSGSKNFAAMYNEALKRTDAKYKIYFKPWVKKIHESLLYKIYNVFSLDANINILGTYGSEIPLDANYIHAQNIFGDYYYQISDKEIKVICGQKPVFIQNVHTIDDSFFVTCTNEKWDVSMNGPFLMTAYCSRIRKNGGKIAVVEQSLKYNNVWVVFSKNKNCFLQEENGKYDDFRREFVTKYKKCYLPLVSIAIPAYNQPVFFEQALNSALQQTYGNIEIVVGDDSTDERINKLIQPYLVKYRNIRYYSHEKPLGRNGISNMDFLVGRCNGKYINLLFQDDLIKSHKISTMMKYYIEDLNDEIGVITSSRYLINEKNSILCLMEGAISEDNQIVSAKQAGRRILQLGINYIGEYSTVLLPKSVLYSLKDEKYRIGVYADMVDSSMADVSTWLEIFRKGLNLVRIAEPLSAFRYHSAQNTHKNMIQIRARMDWLSFYVLSWNNKIFIHTLDELLYFCKNFIKNNPLPINKDTLKDEEKLYYKRYTEFTYLIEHGMKDEFIDVVQKYIKDNSIND